MTVRHLIFDLDDTLYPSSSGMNSAIAYNMISCVAQYFKVSQDEAYTLRKASLPHFGSTLEWLMHEGFSDPEKYFSMVHPENETDGLQKAPKLRPLLLSIDIPKTILTNAPSEHAERVLAFLGVRDLFDSITDIRACGLKGKPYPPAYRAALAEAGGTVDDSLFIDDQLKYVIGYKNYGGIAVQVGNGGGAYQSSVIPDVCKKQSGTKEGFLYHIESVYELPSLLKQLA